MKPVINTEYQ